MKYLFGVIVGAAIGYFTNWLAIKMLFRPYEEKRIFGFKVPFTPGLIPKERKRIAKSIGEAIGSHLLTKETILNSLCSDKINEALSAWVKKEVKKLENGDSTIEDNLKELLSDHYGEIRDDIKENITDIVIQGMGSDVFKEEITLILQKEVSELLKTSPEAVLSSKEYIELRNTAISALNSNIKSDGVKEKITSIIVEKINNLKESNSTVEEILPPTIIGNLKVYVYNKRYDIGKYIEALLKEDKYEIKIKEVIQNIIATQLNPMVAMFVNPEMIYGKIVSGASDMLTKEETLMDVVLLINEVITKITETKVKEILQNTSEEGNVQIGEKLSGVLIDNLSSSNLIEDFMKNLEETINENETIEALLNKTNINIEGTLVNYIVNKLWKVTENPETKGKIQGFVDKSLRNLETMKMRDVFQKEGRDLSTKLSAITLSLYGKFMESKALEFIELFNVSKVVEEKINEFEVTYAEEIILEIASKELNAITWLGGVLGGILGILSPLLASLY